MSLDDIPIDPPPRTNFEAHVWRVGWYPVKEGTRHAVSPAFRVPTGDGRTPSPLGDAFRRLAVVWEGDDGVPEGLAHGLPVPLPLRLHPKVPQAGSAGRSGGGSAGSRARDLQVVRHRDPERACAARPRAFVAERAADNVGEPSDERHQGEEFDSIDAKLPGVESSVLGPTSLVERVLRRDQRERHRRDPQAVHRRPRCRVPGRRFQGNGVDGVHPARRASGAFRRPSNPPPSGGGAFQNELTQERQSPEPYDMIRGLPSVRGRGLEPRWLLTASTSNAIDSLQGSVSAELERQETAETVEKRLVSAQQNQNVVGGVGDEGRAEVMRALYAALEVWTDGGTTRELRLHVVRLLALLEAVEP